MRASCFALAPVAILLACGWIGTARAVEVLLKNDGFVAGQPVGFMSGFVAGEAAASRLDPPGGGSWQVRRIQFLYGGATTTRTVTLKIWDDAAGTTAPGAEIYSGDHLLTGSDTALQEIDLVSANVVVSAPFRVGLLFQDAGTPSVARDGDGTIQSTRNFIFSPSLPGWAQSSLFGLLGDWVLRAVVDVANPAGTTEAPRILSVTDVGGDQGRQVRLRLRRSNQDAPGAATPVLHYEIHRRVDPGRLALAIAGTLRGRAPSAGPATVALDGWDYVASVPAHGDSIYSVVVPTLADSSVTSGQHWSAFFVRAATAAPLTYYDSPADSGYSVDNLPPAPPGAFAASRASGVTALSWAPSPEPDLWHYRLHRGAGAAFVPSESNLIAVSNTTGFEDAAPAGAYYKLAAVDVNGNVGEFALATPGVAGVPGPPSVPLSLAIAGPNPLRGSVLPLELSLPRAGSARVQVMDLAGRRVASRELGTLDAGRHRIELALPASAPAGVLFVRLGHDAGERVVRAARLP